MVEEGDVDRGDVGVGGDDVVGEVVVDGRAEAWVVLGLFEERHADAHDDGAFDLVARGLGVEDAAGVDDGDDTRDAEPRDLGLPGDLGELNAEGVGGELALWISEGAFALAGGGGCADVRLGEELAEGYA